MNELRKKILLMADETINLNTIIAETNALKAVTRQLEDFSRTKAKQEINKLEMAQKNIKTKCLRCGSVNHLAEDKKFPARNKKCLKCGYIGHYREYCKTIKKKYSGFKSNTKEETQSTKK